MIFQISRVYSINIPKDIRLYFQVTLSLNSARYMVIVSVSIHLCLNKRDKKKAKNEDKKKD